MPLLHEKLMPSWPGFLVDKMPALVDMERAEAQFISTVPVILADEIAVMYYESARDEWTMVSKDGEGSDFPNCAPPLSACFIEWNSPGRMLLGNEYLSEPAHQSGAMVIAFDFSRAGDRLSHLPAITALMTRGMTDVIPDVLTERITDAVVRCRWMLNLSFWMAPFNKPACGLPCWVGGYASVFVDSDGQLVSWFPGGPMLWSEAPDGSVYPSPDLLNTPVHIVLLAFSFMHCRNIIQCERTDITPKKWLRRVGKPAIRYTVLSVGGIKSILASEGNLNQNGLRRALHICRGHFRHYGEDSPGMFGHLHGTFWVPQHIRGHANAGKVIKDYQVERPN